MFTDVRGVAMYHADWPALFTLCSKGRQSILYSLRVESG